MDLQRRSILSTVTAVPALAWLSGRAKASEKSERLVLSSFIGGENFVVPGGGWRGFSDRVMGGVSNAKLTTTRVADKGCLRLTGNVSRESNGGFIQMALYFGSDSATFDASKYKGIELLTYGNNEDYNVHIRTPDCGWYDDSYRTTFFARPAWERVRLPWSEFMANNVSAPLDSSKLQRVAVLGWMREFQADIALAEIALYS